MNGKVKKTPRALEGTPRGAGLEPSASLGAASAVAAGALKFDRSGQLMHGLYEAARREVEGDRRARVDALRAQVQGGAFRPDLQGLAARLLAEFTGRAG